MNRGLVALVGLSLGAGIIYLTDPNEGRRRRARLRDATVHASHTLKAMAGMRSRAVGRMFFMSTDAQRCRFMLLRLGESPQAGRILPALTPSESGSHVMMFAEHSDRACLRPCLSRLLDKRDVGPSGEAHAPFVEHAGAMKV